MARFGCVLLCLAAMLLSGCITTAMQGYADRDLPAQPVQRIAAYVVAPTAQASSFQSSIAEEPAKRGIGAEDAYARSLWPMPFFSRTGCAKAAT